MVKVINTERISTGSNDSLNSIIPRIKQQSDTIADDNRRLLSLQTNGQNRTALPTADLIMDNIPNSAELAFTPPVIIQKLQEALKITNIFSNVISFRNFVKKLESLGG